MKKKNEISDDFLVYRVGNGIRLVRPEEAGYYDGLSFAHFTHQDVGSLLALPISMYFLNSDGATQKMSEEGAAICGFDSPQHSLGKTLFEVTVEDSASALINNCKQVIEFNVIKMFNETNVRKDNIIQQFLSIKSPWYNNQNNIIGIYGCSIVLGKHALAESLTILQNLGLLNNHENIKHDLRLPKRQMECLQLTLKGYSAKRVAKSLGISHRTVEEYINIIKSKLGASSKADMIEKASKYIIFTP